MGKIMHKKIKSMSTIAKTSLISLFTLLLMIGIYQGWQSVSFAAITGQSTWLSAYTGTSFPNSTTLATLTIPSGSNRLLVVAVSSTTSAVGAVTITNGAGTAGTTPTVGGVSSTLAAGDAATTTNKTHTALYYLKEADIAVMTGSALSLRIANSALTSRYNTVSYRIYTGVDQSSPITNSQNFTSVASSTAVGPFATALAVGANDQAIEIVSLTPSTTSTTARTISTWATTWPTSGITAANTTTLANNIYVRERSATATATTDTSQHVASATGTYKSMTALSMKAAATTTALSVSNNTPIAATGTRLDTDTGVLMQRVQVTGTGAMELNSLTLNDLGTTSVLASAEIYISLTAATVLPVDAVLVGSSANWAGTSTQFALTAGTTANRSLGGSEPLTKYIYIVYDMSSGQASKTVQSSITAVGVVSPNVSATGLTMNSNVVTLDYSGNLLTTSANTAGASNAKDSDVAVVMQHFKVDCNTAFDNALEINSITLQELGTTSQVSAVKIYVATTEDSSPSVLPATAKQIGQITEWNKTSTAIPLNNDFGATAADRTVLAGTSKYLYVVYSMFYPDDADYVAGKTVQSQVTAVGVASPDSGVTGQSYLSNTITLTRGTWSRITSCGGCHDTANILDEVGRNSTATYGREGRFPGSHYLHSNKDSYDCLTCHVKPTVYNHASGFINFSGLLYGDKYSRSTGNKVATSNSTTQFGTCSVVTCHGNGSPRWAGDTAAVQCDKCHAGPTFSGAFYSTAPTTSNTDSHTGAHTSHIQGTHGIASKITCSTCHIAVAGLKDSGHMNGSVNFNSSTIPSFTGGNCTTTCHKGKSVAWATPFMTGNKATDCTMCHGVPAASHAQSIVTDYNTRGFVACVTCHKNVNPDGTFVDITKHMNGIVEADGVSAGGSDCSSCHTTLATMTSDTTTYHHVIASTSAVYAGNTCLKCHADHDIFNNNAIVKGGVAANLRVDNAVVPVAGDTTTYANTDFVAGATNGGICSSCHYVGIAKNTTNQKTSADINATTMVVTKAQFAGSMHNYTTTSTYTKDSSKFIANCIKCHNDTLAETKQTGSKTFGLHLSATRELFTPLGATTGQDAREGYLCFGCHSVQGQQIDAQTKKPTAGKDWYGSRSMRASAEDTFNSFSTATRLFRHNTGKYTAKHQVGESETYIAANKHVECADCHNSHGANYGNHTQGSATLANVLVGATGLVPTYGGAGSFGLPGVTGTTLYVDTTTPPVSPNSTHTSGVTFTSSTWQSAGMSSTTPVSSTATTKTITTTATSGNYNGEIGFVSPAMTNGSTLNAQTVTFTIYANCASATTPPRLYGTMSLWNGTTATQLVASTQMATLTTTSAAYTLTASIPQTSIANATTVLVAELYLNSRGSAQVGTISYNSTGAQSKFVFSGGATWNTASSYTPGTATQEYQICFKCHSAANTGLATWGGTAAAAWTDLAMEFNPSNASRHPIGTPLAVGSQLTAAKLAGGWTPGQVMNCTDCHATDSTASKGPHGSAVKWMLAGTNKAWPYNAASANGKSTGTLFLVNTYNAGVGTVNGLFCLNCHTVTASNNFHSVSGIASGQHASSATVAACVSCHIRVPHGGKITRLRLTTNAPTRYRADGNATAPAFGGWAAPGSAAGSATIKTNTCGQHSGASATEAW